MVRPQEEVISEWGDNNEEKVGPIGPMILRQWHQLTVTSVMGGWIELLKGSRWRSFLLPI